MTYATPPLHIDSHLAHLLIQEQFPEYADLPITSVEKQGHDNRTYRLGKSLLIRLPTAESYALKVPKEQALLPKLAPHLTLRIPSPIKMGVASSKYPYPFSIYAWIDGKSLNQIRLDDLQLESIAPDLASFLRELQDIKDVEGPPPGQHNWWRGDHISVYDKDAREQIAALSTWLDASKALHLWETASETRWNREPVWIHGDFAPGNILMHNGKVSAVIDFGGMGVGDPACDLVIAWTLLHAKARKAFIHALNLDEATWLRARAWALWKATFELCSITDKQSSAAQEHLKIVNAVLSDS